MPSKVKERPKPMQLKADDPHCTICHPRPDRVPHDVVWRRSRVTREWLLKDGVKV